MLLVSSKRRVGRTNTVAVHPRLRDIELALAGAVPVRKVAERYRLSRSALYRYWTSIPNKRRADLQVEAAGLEGRRLWDIASELLALADRHPEARDDITNLARRIQRMRPAAAEAGGLADVA